MILLLVGILITGCGSVEKVEETTGNLSAEELKEAVVIVNDQFMPVEEFKQEYDYRIKLYVSTNGEEILKTQHNGVSFLDMLKSRIAKEEIYHLLVSDYLKKQGFTVETQQVDDALTKLKESIHANPETESFYNKIGLTDDYYRIQIVKDFYNKEFITQIKAEATEDEQEIKALSKTKPILVKARNILVDNQELALELKEKVEQGESFAELAMDYSLDPGSKDKGGDLGYFTKYDVEKTIADAAFSLPTGTVSEPLVTQLGYVIIQVEDQKTLDQIKQEEKDEVLLNTYRSIIIEDVSSALYIKKIKAMEEQATIEIYLDKVESDWETQETTTE